MLMNISLLVLLQKCFGWYEGAKFKMAASEIKPLGDDEFDSIAKIADQLG